MRKKLSRRAALTGLAAIAPATAVAAIPEALGAELDGDERVFAAIEEHKAACTSIDTIYKEGRTWKGFKPYQMGHQPMADARSREIAAMMALLNTMPRTRRGLACVLQYLGRQPDARWDDIPDMLSMAQRSGNADLVAVSASYIARLATAVFAMIAAA
jgi:hypothetical protein